MGDEPTHDTDSDNSDFVFSVKTGKKRPTMAVMINGIKGHMEADSGASANIMDNATFTPRYEWVGCGPVWKRNLDSTTRDHSGGKTPHGDPKRFLAFTPKSDAVWDTSKK